MNRNSLLFGLLGVLLIVAYLVLQKPGEISSSGESKGKLLEIDSLSVDKVEVKTPALNLVLEKKGMEWFIQQPVNDKADESVVAGVIHQVKTLDVTGIVSSNPEKHSVFMVDSTGASVTVYEKGSTKASFVIGKASPSFTETYVRMAKSNDVASVLGTFGYMFSRPLREWRNKVILSMPQETIREVKFQFGDTTFTLAQKDTMWVIGKDAVDLSVIQSLFSSLANIVVDDFVDSTLSPVPKITAQVSYGGQQVRFAFSKPLAKYYVQTSASPRWYVMEPWRTTSLLKRKKELVKPAN